MHIKQKQYEKAIEVLKRATQGDKAKAFMYNNLGIALERLDRVEEALASYKSGLLKGSGIAGQNFVRLERKLTVEQTAQNAPIDEDDEIDEFKEPSDPGIDSEEEVDEG